VSERCEYHVNPFADENEGGLCTCEAQLAVVFRRVVDGHQEVGFRCMEHWKLTNDKWEVLEARFLSTPSESTG
jgi:hypothetical protein